MIYPAALRELIERLARLPGIGPKSAQRIAFWVLSAPEDEVEMLAEAISHARRRITRCRRCFNLAEGDVCSVCADPSRDRSVMCVVEEPRDVIAVERTGAFKGLYHVLGGALDPMSGIGPDQLTVNELAERIRSEAVREVILCTNPTVEGDATAAWLSEFLAPLGVKVTRVASGLPVGGDLEYADEVTLGRALEGRRELASDS
ncbi:MAG: recombination protein RecR [Acidimicrobiales bacterium]|nr:MAG: recombination protein RecR [Acidimicrobiales bacterium]